MVDFMEEENAEMLADEELRKLYAAMSKLTERQQEVVQLYFYKGMTQEEIGAELGLDKSTVCRNLSGALKKSKRIFEELCNFCSKSLCFMRGASLANTSKEVTPHE